MTSAMVVHVRGTMKSTAGCTLGTWVAIHNGFQGWAFTVWLAAAAAAEAFSTEHVFTSRYAAIL